jgi:hypothetical protein
MSVCDTNLSQYGHIAERPGPAWSSKLPQERAPECGERLRAGT